MGRGRPYYQQMRDDIKKNSAEIINGGNICLAKRNWKKNMESAERR